MSDNNPSTRTSYLNEAAAAIHSGVASVTGSSEDKTKAEQAKKKSEDQRATSQSAAKIGPYSVGPEGGVAKDSPERTQGRYDQTVGSVNEATGRLIGNDRLVQSGRQRSRHGEEQEAKGQLSDLGRGVSERVQGAVGGVTAALTGDRAEQQRHADIHDEGKARQRGVETELDRKAGI
ncbi:hypothetical protein SAPIO_CDS1851 [Scedosporium apiospermum]|uniref:CsbD-like domain-containing protein n=1 Tax=Pseudallescheria apiosperma TaxID=563466 RepID=A0A084GDW1_PSEDA|nr:uncharacterized protein SAPIO_CDS1851 [Scedosporium apiospermum]KEZ45523.1 hypothetical protein SAPIO_CDS1851 [Scedosporium apiospermum]